MSFSSYFYFSDRASLNRLRVESIGSLRSPSIHTRFFLVYHYAKSSEQQAQLC
jgi:hypothetical protein